VSAAGGQRRTVAARGEWLPDLILARLRIREVQALEVVGIGDRDLEPRRVRVDELAGGKEHAELLLPCRAPGQARIREPAVRPGGGMTSGGSTRSGRASVKPSSPGPPLRRLGLEIASLSARSPRKLDSRAMSTMGPPGTFSRP